MNHDSASARNTVQPTLPSRPDWPFYLAFALLGGVYVILIVAMLVADLFFTSPDHLLNALNSREIRYSIALSLFSCTATTVLSLLVGIPLGYLLARTEFFGKTVVDTLLDIPIVLPPLVIGLSLLILFQVRIPGTEDNPPGPRASTLRREDVVNASLVGLMGAPAGHGPLLATAVLAPRPTRNLSLERFIQDRIGFSVTFAVPSVILAQFAVAAAFAVRTMRVTFEQISPRSEQVALTLGCSRASAFFRVVMPQARRGLLTAATLAWARSLGEFGPILVFSGATRMRTEVLPTTVFLELSVGKIEAAIAVSLLMVVVAVVVLVVTRLFGLRGTGLI